MQHFYSVVDAMLVLEAIHPKSETGKISRNSRYAKSHALQRSVSPRLIIGRINAQILSQYQVVIVLVENSIFAVLIARNKNNFHLIFGTVVHTEVLQHIQDLVMRHIVQPVCNERHFQRSGIMFVLLFQTSLQVLTRITHPTGNVDESQHFLFQILIAIQTVQ